jgi:hypothetical protein
VVLVDEGVSLVATHEVAVGGDNGAEGDRKAHTDQGRGDQSQPGDRDRPHPEPGIVRAS